jgi:UDP-glucose 4-epimerase
VVRPFNVYGPRQTGEGAVSNFLAAAAKREPLTVYNEGTALRSWCYVSDIVDAVTAIVAAPQRAAGKVFNIGNPGEVETTLGLARRVVRLFPGATIQFRKVERAEVRARVPDISRSRELLGFEPKVDLEEGLRLTKAWYLGRTATA